MKLKKTDRRFRLYCYGFDCYIEFDKSDWRNYNRYVQHCRKQLGDEHFDFAGRTYQKGNWHSVSFYRNRSRESKRIYFRGEKYHTLLMMAMPVLEENTYYL